MKKLFIATVVLLSVQFASAQSADFKKDVVSYIKMSGSAAQVTAVLEPIIEQIPEDKRADFKKDLDSSLPSLYEKIADVMMKHYTHDDIKKMIEFYNSPVGKKIQEVTPKITKDQMKAGQEWGMELQGILMKYMQ
ncbi:DUF2059 domain-containing protein [Flavobacterium sp. xlx-214]|uniref:DUF2059 domain-containing protein n=1 Tax=unclassified Flavobacterium TaxID=196869 RepID=UPI0013D594FA|nr:MULTISPECIES: DUF2059 domain-containing protein [unclassified Flavobacterium]MBA5792164.1 DUF2059 domain-containing protein [Flavobacterium sp. xlx-221]QMI84409.1 DUF2059 domain-containing protein [Flavobacterium sp. xlx-214]